MSEPKMSNFETSLFHESPSRGSYRDIFLGIFWSFSNFNWQLSYKGCSFRVHACGHIWARVCFKQTLCLHLVLSLIPSISLIPTETLKFYFVRINQDSRLRHDKCHDRMRFLPRNNGWAEKTARIMGIFSLNWAV